MEEWLTSPAPRSRCPGAILPLLAAYPLSPLGPAKSTSLSGFPRHLAPTVKVSFLPPSHPDRKGGGRRPDLNKEREESQEKRQPQPPPGSSRSPSPLPRTARAHRCPPDAGGRTKGVRSERRLRRARGWLGLRPPRGVRACGQGAGHPGRLPKTESGSGNPQPPPTRGQPPPAARLPRLSGVQAAHRGRGRPETHR